MSKTTSFLLLLIILEVLSFHGGQSRSLTSNTDIHEVGDERPIEKKKEEAVVVVLTQNNFTEFVNQNKYVMVNFYARWCPWSRRLAPEYEAAAPMVADEAALAKVDASTENNLTYRYKVNGYPTVIFFVGGVRKEDYNSKRTRGEIAKWVQKKIEEYSPRATITTEKEKELVLVTASDLYKAVFGPAVWWDKYLSTVVSKRNHTFEFAADIRRLGKIAVPPQK